MSPQVITQTWALALSLAVMITFITAPQASSLVRTFWATVSWNG